MHRTIRNALVALTLVASACGHVASDDEPAGTSVPPTSASATTASSVAPTTAVRTCLSILTSGLKLNLDYSRDVKSFAGANEAEYKARARALADEARQLGCPVPASIQSFLR